MSKKDEQQEQQDPKPAINVPDFICEKVDDLREAYPALVAEIEANVIADINKATAGQVKEKLPDMYERIVTDAASAINKMPSGPGFLLEIDDPFADGALRTYKNLKGVSGLRLPYVLLYKEKGKTAVDKKRLQNRYEASETLKRDFKNVDAYIEFESLIIVRAIRSYILRAEGAGDIERANNARKALKKIK